jgi:DNA-binding protein H-NS
MRRPKFKSLSLDQLVDLRDTVTGWISKKAQSARAELEAKLQTLGDGVISGGGKRRGRPPGRSKLKGQKVAPKYRNPKDRSEIWAGRGATPRWLRAELKKGRKLESFAIKRGRPKSAA